MTNYSKIKQKKLGLWINKQDRKAAELETKRFHKFECDSCRKDTLWRADRVFRVNQYDELCCDDCFARI